MSRDDARVRSRTRRSLLASSTATAAGLFAGCLETLRDGPSEADDAAGDAAGDVTADVDDPTADLPAVENPPDVVYVPSHREGTQMLEPVRAGDYVVGAMVSYAHPFWTITDDDVEPVEVGTEDDVHLMATVWDAETETVLPTDEGITMRVFDDAGDLVDERSPWTMLSQPMGFHFGDNVPLEGDGTYELEVELPPPSVRTTGAFDGRFEAFETVGAEFTYDQSLRDSLVDAIEYVEDDVRGQPGALEPGHGGMADGGMAGGEMDTHDGGMDGGGGEMNSSGGTVDGSGSETGGSSDGMDESGGEMDDGVETNDSEGQMDGHGAHDGNEGHGGHSMPVAQLPAPSELPGVLQHDADAVPRSHDADVPVAVVDSFHGQSPYLLVSPRTPYNAIPLPSSTLSAVVTRDGAQIASAELVPSLDEDAGFHYGATIDGMEPGDDLEVRVDAPPQIARHQGYETAFVDMRPIELTLEAW